MMPDVADVVVLAGPSGSGKSRLADRIGLPLLRLDDFYRSAGDPALPRGADGLVDWDDPASWLHDEAVAAVADLCSDGRVRMPTYAAAVLDANDPDAVFGAAALGVRRPRRLRRDAGRRLAASVAGDPDLLTRRA